MAGESNMGFNINAATTTTLLRLCIVQFKVRSSSDVSVTNAVCRNIFNNV
jgi:hypothetical protein